MRVADILWNAGREAGPDQCRLSPAGLAHSLSSSLAMKVSDSNCYEQAFHCSSSGKGRGHTGQTHVTLVAKASEKSC